MALQDKYQPLIQAAQSSGVKNLQVKEQNNVLFIDGEAPTASVKDQLWNIYKQLDPNYRAGDLRLNITIAAESGSRAKVTTDSTNLNIRKEPGTEAQIVGKAAHGEIVTILDKANEQWWKIKTDAGTEGFVYSQYLRPQ